MEHSYAYREGKGVLVAVMQARAYIQEGASYLVEIDLNQYFDTIPLERLYELLTKLFSYQAVLDLLRHYLYCQVSFEGRIVEQTKGLIQGSAISPVLSNLYLLDLDRYMETKGMNWIRFADNIYIFCKRREEAEALYSDVVSVIETQFSLTINQKKSGVFRALQHRMLGYDFIMKEGELHCQKHHYTPVRYYPTWHQSPLRFVNQQYHIVEGGILTKKDFSLLFETEEYRYHLPIEVIEQIDIYSDVFVSPTTLIVLAEKRIPLVIHNRFGQIQSYFIPESMKSRAPIVLAQCQLYQDEARRLMIAKKIEEAHLHNLRANCRYYQKKHPQPELNLIEEGLTGLMKDIHSKKSVQELMLLEGRARQIYYQLFNLVIRREGFGFMKRTKRPPQDPLNALISFCNTVLYSQVLKVIWKKGLDPQISILHASTNRPYSLHLDFADYMKPVIVDRVIFSLVNRHQLDAQKHFEYLDTGAVLLNADGKRLVLTEMEDKLHTKLMIKDSSYTYLGLIERDVAQLKDYILQKTGEKKRFKTL